MLRPDLSWAEDATSEEDARLAARIVSELYDRLLASGECRRVSYAALPHPGLFDKAEAKVLSAAGRVEGFSVVPRRDRPNAYVANDPALFARVLPVIIRAGRPEVTLLAFCDVAVSGRDTNWNDVLTRLVENDAEATGIRHVGMHYDSDDLVEIF